MTATSSPSNVGRSKSPNAQPDADDNDMQISETSDLSSMQSSMGPSGLGKVLILLGYLCSVHELDERDSKNNLLKWILKG
jgi:hypothetical protein